MEVEHELCILTTKLVSAKLFKKWGTSIRFESHKQMISEIRSLEPMEIDLKIKLFTSIQRTLQLVLAPNLLGMSF
jgi:hypothetical protein